MRENLRLEVDRVVEKVLDVDTPEELWQFLRRIDPRIMSLYYDRLNAATVALRTACCGREAVEIPASWPTFVAQILFQKRPQ